MKDAANWTAKTKKQVKSERIDLQMLNWIPCFILDESHEASFVLFSRAHSGGETAEDTWPLLDHPYLANRFVCTPPVNHVNVACSRTTSSVAVKNINGVTVEDAYCSVLSR